MTTFQARALRTWLIDRIAYYLECESALINPTRSLADYGLDSVLALTLCGDLEDRLGIRLEPTVVWDHPTVDELVAHCAGVVPADRGTV
ncbi:acyl carrier protein [Micromonospora sp. CPCC 205539]|uniref:acyl carrier protein n=1 Tax=Micromonospora sp. CPCC 205539 TaxID=3122408 RepID=UPI002FEE981F